MVLVRNEVDGSCTGIYMAGVKPAKNSFESKVNSGM